MTTHTEINIAGVPWPMYKVVALILGAMLFVAVGFLAGSLGPAVLTAAAATTVVCLAGGASARR